MDGQPQMHNFDVCIVKDQETLAIDPRFVECYGNMTNGLKEKGTVDLAIRYYLVAIEVGNAYFEDYLIFGKVYNTNTMGMYEYYWTHAMISNESRYAIVANCKYPDGNITGACAYALDQVDDEKGDFDVYNVYHPSCRSTSSFSYSGLAPYYDPCTDNYVDSYLNLAEVSSTLHATMAKKKMLKHCSSRLAPLPVASIACCGAKANNKRCKATNSYWSNERRV